MKKRRKVKKATARRKVKKTAPKVKRVKLPVAGIVEVVVPKGAIPVIVADPARNVVEIAPVPRAEKKSWWRSFG